MELGGASIPGPRPYNEDTYLTIDLSALSRPLGGLDAFLLVSDGMGGHQGGDVASKAAANASASYVHDLMALAEKSDLDVDVAKALQEIGMEADSAVKREADARGGSNMGATLVCAFVGAQHVWVGHIGDSRAYLVRDGGARQLTVDHSQVGRLIAEGVLTEEQAQHHPSRNVIDRALGFEGAEAEITESTLRPGDALVLCSDGLSTVLSAADIATIVVAQPNADAAARALTDEALKAGTDDNTTCVVWSDDWALLRMSAPQTRRTRREMSKRRREAARHRNASRASIYAMMALGVLALVILAFALTGPRGSGVIAPGVGAPRNVRSQAPSTSVEATASKEQRKPKYRSLKVVDERTWLRSKPSNEESVQVVMIKPWSKVKARKDEHSGYWLVEVHSVQIGKDPTWGEAKKQYEQVRELYVDARSLQPPVGDD